MLFRSNRFRVVAHRQKLIRNEFCGLIWGQFSQWYVQWALLARSKHDLRMEVRLEETSGLKGLRQTLISAPFSELQFPTKSSPETTMLAMFSAKDVKRSVETFEPYERHLSALIALVTALER